MLHSFETVPQVILQLLVFFAVIEGKEFSGVTRRALILSICSASLNSCIQIFRLRSESKAVKETFVQYSLNCITSRFGWVPYEHVIESFVNDQDTDIDGKIVTHEASLTIDYQMK